jgi:hypothetical protein
MAVLLSQPIADGGAPRHSAGSLGGVAPERSLLVRTCSSHKKRGGQLPYRADDLARPEALRNARRPVHPAQLRAPLKKPGDVTGSTPTRSGCSRTDCLRSQGTEAILSTTETASDRRGHIRLPPSLTPSL